MQSIAGSPDMAAQIIRMKEAARGFRSAPRINNALLGNVEKRTLIWLAQHMPRWVNSDHLTLLGITAMFGAGACYAGASHTPALLWGVNGCLALNWFGDSLDGTLARVRDRQRPRYGFYVDHIVDIFGVLALLGGMALSGYMSPLVAAAVLVAFLFLAIESYLTTYTLGSFHLSFGLFGPTELRLLLMIGNCFLFSHKWATVFGVRALLLDVGGLIASACMFLVMIIAVIRHTAQLYDQERLG